MSLTLAIIPPTPLWTAISSTALTSSSDRRVALRPAPTLTLQAEGRVLKLSNVLCDIQTATKDVRLHGSLAAEPDRAGVVVFDDVGVERASLEFRLVAECQVSGGTKVSSSLLAVNVSSLHLEGYPPPPPAVLAGSRLSNVPFTFGVKVDAGQWYSVAGAVCEVLSDNLAEPSGGNLVRFGNSTHFGVVFRDVVVTGPPGSVVLLNVSCTR